jgi:hypothetical protein
MPDLDTDLREIADALVADPPDVPEWPLGASVVSLDGPPRRWLVPVAAAAAVVALGAGALAVVAGRDGPDPAPLNSSPTPSTRQRPPTPYAALRPTAFPVVDDPALAGANPWGSYAQVDFENQRRVAAVVARREGDRLVDAVVVTVEPGEAAAATMDDPATTAPAEQSATTIWGRPATVSVEPGRRGPTTVVLAGSPSMSFSGGDPLAFLERAQAEQIRAEIAPTSSGAPELTLEIGNLPDGYEVIAGPEPRALVSVEASLAVGGTATTEGSGIFVGVADPVIDAAAYDTLAAVDINGASGWITTSRGYEVMWKVDDHTFVSVAGNDSRAEALALARSIRFVDEAAWQARYDVAEPEFHDEARTDVTVPVSTVLGD